MAKENGILLESGTNELEVLEFTVGGNIYGINVAKVREILPYTPATPVPNSNDRIEGIFMPRDFLITVVDLAKCLGLPASDNPSTDMYIVTGFNQVSIAFHVSSIVKIDRISWSDIIAPDATLNNNGAGSATGIIKKDGKLIIVLDFEKIVTEISPDIGMKTIEVDAYKDKPRSEQPIVVAEDSPMLGQIITDCLSRAGFEKIKLFPNGEEAWNYLTEVKANGRVGEDVRVVITDIEMPKMDGHHLLKLIKDDKELKVLPVIVFSSLINDEMKRKGESLGADAQLSKPEIGMLIDTIDRILGR